MASYYIDPAVAPGGLGTEVSPYTSFASVPPLVAGDGVYFKRGTTHVGQVLYDVSRGASGTSGSPIVFGAYGNGAKPVIRSGTWVFDVVGRDGVTVQDLQFGPISSYTDGGIRALNSGIFTAQRCTTESRCDYGIRVDNTGASAISTINILENEVLGTFNNSGVMVIWGSSVGGIFKDVRIYKNTVRNVGVHATTGSPSPYGIRSLSRTTPLTASNGAIDLDLFSLGFQVTENLVEDTCSYGIAYSCVSSGGGATLTNRVGGNTLNRCGDGRYDSHMLWVAGCRDVLVDYNKLDTSVMFQGSTFGTGVGIFVDNFGFGNLYDNSKRITVRRNVVKNTGLKSDGTLNTGLEVAGAGILVYLSQSVDVIDNDVNDCCNGIGAIGWFGGSSGKSDAVTIRGNRVRRPLNNAYSFDKAVNALTCIENWCKGHSGSGFYIENSGAYAITNYIETRNAAAGASPRAFQGGSLPTSTTTPVGSRSPVAGNLALDSLAFE